MYALHLLSEWDTAVIIAINYTGSFFFCDENHNVCCKEVYFIPLNELDRQHGG